MKYLFFTIVACFLTTQTFAATITVSSINDSGPNTLRQAVIDASSGDTITFDNTITSSTIGLSSSISFDKNLVLLGNGISVSGNNSTSIFFIGSSITVELNQLTLTNGNSGNGGAVSNSGNLAINNCAVINNSASIGGAFYNSGNLTINFCTVANNTAFVSGCAIYNETAVVDIKNSTFTGNYFSGYGEPTAIFNAGISFFESSLFVNNTAPLIVSHGPIASNGYNLVANNSNNSFPTDNSTDIVSATAINNVIEATLNDNGGLTPTFALLTGSPAINNGNPANNSNDQRGFPIVGIRDIGAYEFGAVAPIAATPQFEFNFSFSGNSGSLSNYSGEFPFSLTVYRYNSVTNNIQGQKEFTFNSAEDLNIDLSAFPLQANEIYIWGN